MRHGELLLLPIESADMSAAEPKRNYIASHSETGHHHVIEGDCMVLEREGQDTLVSISAATEITHKKTHDRHDSLPLEEGIYKLVKKKEYDPFAKAMREVWD